MKTIGRTGIVAATLLSLLLAAGCSDGGADTAPDHLQKARAADEAGQHADAIREYTLAIDSGELPEGDLAQAYLHRGIIYGVEQDIKKAIADLTRAIELDPKDASGYFIRGDIYGNRGDLDKAIADLSRAIELDPKYAPAYHNRGDLYRKKGEHAKADADLHKAKELGLDLP